MIILRIVVVLGIAEGSSDGELSWCVDWSHTNLKVKKVMIILQHTTFENGCVKWQVCTGDKCISGDKGGLIYIYMYSHLPLRPEIITYSLKYVI